MNPRVITKRLLEITQILFQNNAITVDEKNEITSLIQKSILDHSTAELHAMLVSLEKRVVLFKDYLQEAITLTK